MTQIAPVEPVAAPLPRPRTTYEELAAWLLMAAALIFVLLQHLTSALVAGLALYLLLDRVSTRFSRRLDGKMARPLALLSVVLVTVSLAGGAIALLMTVMRHSAGAIPAMMTKMANILESTRAWLGGYGEEFIPDVLTDADNLKSMMALWLKENAQSVRAAGGWVSIGMVHMIMGILVAVLVFFRHIGKHDEHARGPLARYLYEKVLRFADAFGRVAVAQIKISAVNTSLTALYLLVILPLFGKHVPFGTTLVLVTFICGLIPVLGNLISNTVIAILSLGISFGTAIASLVFLILIHKLEYLINSRIVGSETDSQAWEILLAIIVGESAFGVGGVVLAPIIYAFVKRELKAKVLI